MEKEQTAINPVLSDKGNTESFGKFKTAEELLKAYNALEGEFTRRSQKLKELETVEQKEDTLERKVTKLLSTYPIAENFGDGIAKEISENENLSKEENGLEKAFLNVLAKNFKTTDEMVKDEALVEKILSDKGNREKVIKEYLEGIKKSVVPISLPKGGAIPLTQPTRAKSLKEAGEIAKKIIEENE